jgi:hypothetical protein
MCYDGHMASPDGTPEMSLTQDLVDLTKNHGFAIVRHTTESLGDISPERLAMLPEKIRTRVVQKLKTLFEAVDMFNRNIQGPKSHTDTASRQLTKAKDEASKELNLVDPDANVQNLLAMYGMQRVQLALKKYNLSIRKVSLHPSSKAVCEKIDVVLRAEGSLGAQFSEVGKNFYRKQLQDATVVLEQELKECQLAA